MIKSSKLNLLWVGVKTVSSATYSIVPVWYPLPAEEDAPLMHMLFIINKVKGRKRNMIMSVGGHRAKTKNAFYLKCPVVEIISTI